MFYLFYRIYGHFVFRSPQPPPWGRTTGAVRPEDYPHREGCVRDKLEAQKPTTALASGLNRRILAWSGKRTLCRRSVKKRGRFACKPAKAPVLAMPNNVPAKATCGWFWVPFATKSTTNPQNGQISVVVLTIRLFFVSVRPVEAFEWPAGGIVERGLGFQNVTLFGNASHFIKR